MSAPRVEKIAIWPLDMINAYLLVLEVGAVLVDCGLPGSESKVERALARNGLGWRDIRLIAITHGHVDHVGAAKAIRHLSGAPVLMHQKDVPYAEGVKPSIRVTNRFGHLFKMTGAIETPFETFTPDIVACGPDPLDLDDFGLRGCFLHTPGHTPGSASVLLPGGAVMAGDLLASGLLLGGMAFTSRPKQLHFEEDSAATIASLKKLLGLGAGTFHLGHGGPLSAQAVRRYLDRCETL